MMFEVRVSSALADEIAQTFGPQRSTTGSSSEWDFWGGPLTAALIAFRDFDALRFERVPEIRSLHLVDPVFGALVFVGVLVDAGVVELAAFRHDPDYWSIIENDPNA